MALVGGNIHIDNIQANKFTRIHMMHECTLIKKHQDCGKESLVSGFAGRTCHHLWRGREVIQPNGRLHQGLEFGGSRGKWRVLVERHVRAAKWGGRGGGGEAVHLCDSVRLTWVWLCVSAGKNKTALLAAG